MHYFFKLFISLSNGVVLHLFDKAAVELIFLSFLILKSTISLGNNSFETTDNLDLSV